MVNTVSRAQFLTENLQQLEQIVAELGELEDELEKARVQRQPHHRLTIKRDGTFGNTLPHAFCSRISIDPDEAHELHFWDKAEPQDKKRLKELWNDLIESKLDVLSYTALYSVEDRNIKLRWIIKDFSEFPEANAIVLVEEENYLVITSDLAYFNNIPNNIKTHPINNLGQEWTGILSTGGMRGRTAFVPERTSSYELWFRVIRGSIALGVYPDEPGKKDTTSEQELDNTKLYRLKPNTQHYLRIMEKSVVAITGTRDGSPNG